MADDHEFVAVNAGASQTYPLQCSALRKGGHVMIKVKKDFILYHFFTH